MSAQDRLLLGILSTLAGVAIGFGVLILWLALLSVTAGVVALVLGAIALAFVFAMWRR